MKQYIEIRKQGNGTYLVSVVTGDFVSGAGLYTSKAKADKEAAKQSDEHRKKVDAIQKAANAEAKKLREATKATEDLGKAHIVTANNTKDLETATFDLAKALQDVAADQKEMTRLGKEWVATVSNEMSPKADALGVTLAELGTGGETAMNTLATVMSKKPLTKISRPIITTVRAPNRSRRCKCRNYFNSQIKHPLAHPRQVLKRGQIPVWSPPTPVFWPIKSTPRSWNPSSLK